MSAVIVAISNSVSHGAISWRNGCQGSARFWARHLMQDLLSCPQAAQTSSPFVFILPPNAAEYRLRPRSYVGREGFSAVGTVSGYVGATASEVRTSHQAAPFQVMADITKD